MSKYRRLNDGFVKFVEVGNGDFSQIPLTENRSMAVIALTGRSTSL